MLRWLSGLACAGLFAFCLEGKESVCLKSGFCLEVESHLIVGGKLVIQSGAGTLQMPVEEVEQILPLPTLVAFLPISPVAVVPRSAEELLIGAAVGEGLQPDFLRSVAKVESGLHQTALSPRGAVGLMQLMPNTAGHLGVNAYIADQNAKGGAAYLRELLVRYKGDPVLALAAYNAGPGAVDKYKGVPPYAETRRYIVKVLAEYKILQLQKNPSGATVR